MNKLLMDVKQKPATTELDYAYAELQRYGRRLTGEGDGLNIKLAVNPAAFGTGLGAGDEAPTIPDLDPADFQIQWHSAPLNAYWDDAFLIDVQGGSGIIIGTNSRSVLQGVYRMFHEFGCRFYRPTPAGEYIPEREKAACSVRLLARPDHRHRGICIEGAASLEHVLSIVEWAPKAGFNAYFLQFRDSFTFFERWYKHEGNETMPAEPFTREHSLEFVARIIAAIKLRGMIYHAVGHGWTCESIGFPSIGWHKVQDSEIPEDKRILLAEVGGKRTFFEGIPLNTQLCYSNPLASQAMIDEIVRYVQAHREVDVLHVWLGDNFNNFCECEECRRLSPPDHYMVMINEVDRQLTALGLENRIAFLIYLELLWTPEQVRMNNPDRFIMMYAPIHRTYTSTFLKEGKAPERGKTPRIPFELNKVDYPRDIERNLAFLYEWQKVFAGDSFDFDYHLMWDVHREYSGIRLARVISEDIKGLRQLGLGGLVSCQVQRAFFPNGLAMYTMGHTLFNRDLAFERLAEEYFAAAYGEHAALAWEYLEGISRLMSHEYTRNELPMLDKGAHDGFVQAAAWCEAYLPRLREAAEAAAAVCPNRAEMLHILADSATINKSLAELLSRKAAGTPKEQLLPQWRELKSFIHMREPQLADVMDTFYFTMINEGIIVNDW
jgi:hypothetical protein